VDSFVSLIYCTKPTTKSGGNCCGFVQVKLGGVRFSFRHFETGRELQTDGAAVLKERLPKEVRLNGTCSSGADDDRNERLLLTGN